MCGWWVCSNYVMQSHQHGLVSPGKILQHLVVSVPLRPKNRGCSESRALWSYTQYYSNPVKTKQSLKTWNGSWSEEYIILMQTVLGKKSSACMIGLVSKIFSGAFFSKLFSVIIPVVIKKKKITLQFLYWPHGGSKALKFTSCSF